MSIHLKIWRQFQGMREMLIESILARSPLSRVSSICLNFSRLIFQSIISFGRHFYILTYPIAHYVVAKPLLHVIIMWLCNQTKDDISNCIELTSFLGSCKKRQVSFCNDIVRLVTIASQTFCKCHAQRHDQQKEEIKVLNNECMGHESSKQRYCCCIVVVVLLHLLL